jgi:hypothetical protein
MRMAADKGLTTPAIMVDGFGHAGLFRDLLVDSAVPEIRRERRIREDFTVEQPGCGIHRRSAAQAVREARFVPGQERGAAGGETSA